MMQNKEAIVIAPLLQLVLRPDNGLVFPDMSAYIFLVFSLNTRFYFYSVHAWPMTKKVDNTRDMSRE